MLPPQLNKNMVDPHIISLSTVDDVKINEQLSSLINNNRQTNRFNVFITMGSVPTDQINDNLHQMV